MFTETQDTADQAQEYVPKVFSTHRLGQKIKCLGPGVQTCVEMTSITPGLQYESSRSNSAL